MSRILVIIFVLLANKVAAGYHVAFDKGFTEFAQKQGFKDFNDFQLKDIIYHLAEMGLIPPKTLRNYMMIKDFDKFIVENRGHVGNTFIDVSIKYDISEKQAKIIILSLPKIRT